jgi:hypothetical protein
MIPQMLAKHQCSLAFSQFHGKLCKDKATTITDGLSAEGGTSTAMKQELEAPPSR